MLMKVIISLAIVMMIFCCFDSYGKNTIQTDIFSLISKEEFKKYKDVGDFIKSSPKVTVLVKPDEKDVAQYGKNVMKSLTGSDCDRDGKMDSNKVCNAVFYKLWMKYAR